ncbi:DUF3846 domain-containing protein [Amycolatopsis sp. CA-230715]|uniref:DUF3846 domain-containing protein n=1 Tax=Amycolatopsis sp. CA-230715 TaxID=2745196 RepID=UPI001C01FC2E|nr:DUF3846 domain-containing protein [Amycolatopsis sp. CA-230715]QWF78667.1 hypothetical protein HUW46_02065 [Amycolatopsis sp. CA-230715]
MTDIRGLILTPDGEIEEKWLPPTGHDLLNALYGAINCDAVEAVHLRRVGTMYMDEEGRAEEKLAMPNEYATIVVSGFNRVVYQMYMGTVVILGKPDSDGDDTSLSTAACTYIRTLVAHIKHNNVTVRDLRGRRF